ncbi:MAG: hypothetical protein V1729_00365 [Candidatus Woesearchaeota archaeon]
MNINKKTGIALILSIMFTTLISLALAFPGTSSTYSFDSSTPGIVGGNGTSSTYNLRSTQTAYQPSNGNATSASYSMNMGWFNLSYTDGVVTLAINSVQCSNDTANYYNCTQMPYNANVTHIKVNCTGSGSNVTTVGFKMYNTPDTTYYVNETNYTYNSGDDYVLNSSYKIQDSGEWNLTITCYDTAGNSTNSSTNWTESWGWINVSLVTPSTNTSVTKNEFFTFTSTVECIGGECGTVNMTLDPYEVTNSTLSENESLDDTEEDSQVLNSINLVLKYKGGSQWDEDNDGVETLDGAIDLTVDETEFNWEVNEDHLCTKWMTRSLDNATDTVVCYGSQNCCALAELSPLEPRWDNIFYTHFGKYGATYANVVAAQVMYADYSLEPEDIHSEVYFSTWEETSAEYVDPDVPIEVASVFDEGEEITVEGKTMGEKVEDEPDYETHFVSMEQTGTTFTAVFYHDAESAMQVRTVGNIQRTLSTRYAEPFENVTLVVQLENGILPRFELHLGEESEIFQFGKVIPEVVIEQAQVSIIDREDDKVDVSITKGYERIDFEAVGDEPQIKADMLEPDSPILTTNVAFVENMTDFERATITLVADELVTAIFYCSDFDHVFGECSSWEKTDIAFVQEEGFIRFTVNHFSAYAGGSTTDDAYLVVWDETDPSMPNASQSKALSEQVFFFADYKTSNNGTKITDGTCQINFDGGSYAAMTYNSTYSYYMYNRSFSANGVYDFNINCTHSTYAGLNATDSISMPTAVKNGAVSTTVGATPFYTNSSNPQTCSNMRGGDTCTKTWYVNTTGPLDTSHVFFVIGNMTTNTAYVADNQSSNITLTISANDTTIPTIASINVTPTNLQSAQQVSVYATVTDNVQVDTCWANVTLPNASVVQLTDVCTAVKTYTTQIVGVHNVTVYANDTSSNSVTSSSLTFTVDDTAPSNSTAFSASVTSSSATITATIDEASKCSVSYSTNSSNLNSSANSSAFSTTVSVTLSSLSASTLYYYNITSCWDQVSNFNTTNHGVLNFTTSAATSTSNGGGGGGSTILTACSVDWVCTGWSTCSESGEKTRSCSDANGCGDDSGKPDETSSCIYVLPVGSVDRGAGPDASGTAEVEVVLPLPDTTQAETPVESAPAEEQEPASQVAPAPITGDAVAEHEESIITLETGWWILAMLVFLVIAVTLIIERKKHK